MDDIEAAVDEMERRGVNLGRYPGFDHDEKGVVRGGNGGPAAIAWFTDSAGDVLSVLQEN